MNKKVKVFLTDGEMKSLIKCLGFWPELMCCHGSAGEDGEGSSFFSAPEVVLRARSCFFSLACS